MRVKKGAEVKVELCWDCFRHQNCREEGTDFETTFQKKWGLDYAVNPIYNISFFSGQTYTVSQSWNFPL